MKDTITLSGEHQTITFLVDGTWVIKITKDGIISNPDVPIDDGAKAIFAALEPYIRGLR